MAGAERIPPSNLEAEQSVLGCMLVDKEAASLALETLQAEDFYTPRHQEIFRAMAEVSAEAQPIDLVTVNDKLEQQGNAGSAGGIIYLSDMARSIPTAVNAVSYINIVQEKAVLRAIIRLGSEMIEMGYEQEQSDKILESVQKYIYDTAVKKNASALRHIREALMESYGKILEAAKSKTGITGVPTGFETLDEMTTGLHGGELVVLAGRPGTGKTSLALNIAKNVAKAGYAVPVFSLEMSAEQLATRILCTDATVDLKSVRGGLLQEEDYLSISESYKRLSTMPIYIDDTTGITVGQIRFKAMRLGAKKKLGLVIIDYLQLMQGSGKSESRVLEVAEITRSLKGLARDLGVPVMALSQLSRDMERRKGGKPMLSDLRESGAIEQDADMIMFIHREEMYGTEGAERGKAELIIGKNRHGSTGSIDLSFIREYTKFENYAHEDEGPI